MGGPKGQSTTQSQSTYSPDPQARAYMLEALQRANQTANLPFNLPQAPVAGFSPDQLTAFGNVNAAQGMAQPYLNQAANYYNQGATGSNIQNFFNPFASAVTANLKDIFGAQQSQLAGNLTQQAGGIGADRIAVGQAELAKQQGLAAGQTLASLYQPALQAAQNAAFQGGQGLGNIGLASQNAALQGAQAQLGTGGLQQQLAQQQMNAPYQWQVAKAAFPYQQSQFLSGAVGALAPGLGGTTYGQSTTTPAQPSLASQILGGVGAIGSGLGASGAFGNTGWLTGSSPYYGGGNFFSGDAYGGSSYNPLPGLSASDYGAGFSGGGRINPFADGGAVGGDSGAVNLAESPFVLQLRAIAQQGAGGGNTGGGASGKGASGLGAIGSLLNMISGGQIPWSQILSGGLGGSAAGAPAGDPGTAPGSLGGGPGVPGVFGGSASGGGKGSASGGGKGSAFGGLGGMIGGSRGFADGGAVSDEPIDIEGGFIPQTKLVAIQPHIPQLPQAQSQKQDSGGGLGGLISTAAKILPFFMQHGGRVNPFADGGAVDDPFGDENRMLAYELLRRGQGTRAPDSIPGGEPAPEPIRLAGPEAMNAWRQGVDATNAPDTSPAPNVESPPLAYAQSPDSDGAGLPPQITSGAAPAEPRGREPSFLDSPWAPLLAASLGIMGGTSPFAGVNIGRGAMEGLKSLQQQRENAQKDETVAQAARRLDQEAQRLQLRATQKVEKSTAALLDDDTVDMMADQYLAGDKSIFANLGRGAQGPENIAKLRAAIARKVKEQGGTGKDQAAAVANFGAQAAAAKTAAVRSANIDIAVEEARQTFPLALQASEAVPRGQWVPWNRAVQAVQAGTSSPALARFVTANQAVITAYGQAMSRTGTNTVHAQESAEKLLSTVTSPESYKAVIAQLEQEMQAAKTAPDLVRKEILSRISGRHNAPAAGASVAPSKPPVVYQNGHEYRLQPDGSYQ